MKEKEMDAIDTILSMLCLKAINECHPVEMLSSLMESALAMQKVMIDACGDNGLKAEMGEQLVKATLNGLVEASKDKKYLPYKRYVKCYKTKDNEQKIDND